MNISKHVDYTSSNPTTTKNEVIDLCQFAKKNKINSVCIGNNYVPLAKQLLADSNVEISTIIGYPLGSIDTKSKVSMAQKAIEEGASEIDMVIDIASLKNKNYNSVLSDINEVKSAIGNKPLKVILEIPELNKNEIVKACEICLDANADYIRTSTGYSKGGATLAAVKIIKKTVRKQIKIDACGDINDFKTAARYIEAGADRVATSSNIDTSLNETERESGKAIFS